MHGTARAAKTRALPIEEPRDLRLEETAAIKAALYLAKLTLLEIDRRFVLKLGTAGNTLKKPNLAGEKAIAEALGTKAHLLWPTRYHASGLRKTPQPRENYLGSAPLLQRQYRAGEST